MIDQWNVGDKPFNLVMNKIKAFKNYTEFFLESRILILWGKTEQQRKGCETGKHKVLNEPLTVSFKHQN